MKGGITMHEFTSSINIASKMSEIYNSAIFDELSEVASKFSEICSSAVFDELSEVASKFSEIYSSAIFDELSEVISKFSTSTMLKNLSSLAFDLNANGNPFDEIKIENSNDYVITDKTTVKEWQFPESVIFTIGRNRVRINTSYFLTLLSIILPLVFGGCPTHTESNTSIEVQETQELLQKQNRLLQDLIYSIDSSHSSQHELIESVKEVLQEDDYSRQSSVETSD